MFERCLAIDSQNEYAILSLVDIQFRRGAWEQAKEPLDLILQKSNPRLGVVATNAMALVELMTGNLESAEESLNLLSENSSEVEPYLLGAIKTNQARFHLLKEEFDEAIEVAQEVVNLIPNSANAPLQPRHLSA